MNYKTIATKAVAARTLAEAQEVQDLIEKQIGGRHQRAVGDKGNNQGLITQSGSSFDHKAIELVTNMQDTVLERFAIEKYGSVSAVPYRSPHEAAKDLLGGRDKRDLAEMCRVSIDEFAPGESKKRVTITHRDMGCGISPSDVPKTIFQLGAGRKNGVDWLQGTFGVGGPTNYRNTKAVVLVTRRRPEMLAVGELDGITLAVVQWERRLTTSNAFYLVVKQWDEDDPVTWAAALPMWFPAAEYPDFEPGTQLSLIGFDTTNFERRSGDEKSYDTVANTRLYRPVVPIGYRNNIKRDPSERMLYGLERRLDDHPGEPGTDGS